MSAENGKRTILQIGGKLGTRKFQYADKTPIVELDVVHVSNLWYDIERQFREADGTVKPERYQERSQEAVRFAAEVLQVPIHDMDTASALHFLTKLDDEVEALKPFFERKSEKERSSRENTEVIFST